MLAIRLFETTRVLRNIRRCLLVVILGHLVCGHLCVKGSVREIRELGIVEGWRCIPLYSND
jgi:hypothetical protein